MHAHTYRIHTTVRTYVHIVIRTYVHMHVCTGLHIGTLLTLSPKIAMA